MENTIKNKKLLVFLLVCCILSLCIHSYLSYTHFQLKLGLFEGKSFCNINEKLNCDAVSLSPYSELLGVPLASWGAATHLFFFILLSCLFFGLSSADRLLRYSQWLSAVILAASIVMIYISVSYMNIFCLFCMATYVLSIIQFLLMALLQPIGKTFNNLFSDLKALTSSHIWVAVIFALIPASTYLSKSMLLDAYGAQELNRIISNKIEAWKTNPSKDFNLSTGLHFQSDNSQPKMVIVEFADFLCPHCKAAAEPLHNYILSRKGIQLIYKPFPLDGVCNESTGMGKHDGLRCELTYSVFCTEEIAHKGWNAHQYVFEHQSDWRMTQLDEQIKTMSENLSIDFQQLKVCMQNPETKTKILAMAKEGNGIPGTPTVFVNNKELPNGQFLPVLDAAAKAIGL